MLITRTPLNTLADLKGLRVGVEKSAVGALFLQKILEMAGLNEKDVVVVDTPIEQQLSSWDSGMLDAMISYNPVATQLLQREAHSLLDSRATPNLIIDVLAVRSDMAVSHTNHLRHLIASHFRVLQRMRVNPQDTAYRMASHLGLTGSEVLMAYRGMLLPDIAVNRSYLSGDGEIVKAAEEISEILLRGNLLSRPAPLTDLTSSNYLPVE
jgi:NitT/TauT family transport system substrate-binding protein